MPLDGCLGANTGIAFDYRLNPKQTHRPKELLSKYCIGMELALAGLAWGILVKREDIHAQLTQQPCPITGSSSNFKLEECMSRFPVAHRR